MWNFIKRDLTELAIQIKEDAVQAASVIDDIFNESLNGPNNRVAVTRHASANVRALRADQKTYTVDISDGDYNSYQAFISNLDLTSERQEDEMDDLLEEDENMAHLYATLVPTEVSHEYFWFRYFFRLNELNKKESAVLEAVTRAQEEEENLNWGDDEDDIVNQREQIKFEAQEPELSNSSIIVTPSEDEKNEKGSIQECIRLQKVISEMNARAVEIAKCHDEELQNAKNESKVLRIKLNATQQELEKQSAEVQVLSKECDRLKAEMMSLSCTNAMNNETVALESVHSAPQSIGSSSEGGLEGSVVVVSPLLSTNFTLKHGISTEKPMESDLESDEFDWGDTQGV